MKTISAMVLLFLSLSPPIFTAAFEFNTGERVKIGSDYLNEEREIQVLLPESYHNHPVQLTCSLLSMVIIIFMACRCVIFWQTKAS